MTQSALPTGRGLMWRMHGFTVLVPLPGLGVLLACLFTLLELTREQWLWFVGAVAVYTVIFSGSDHGDSAALGDPDRAPGSTDATSAASRRRRCGRPSPRACAFRFAPP